MSTIELYDSIRSKSKIKEVGVTDRSSLLLCDVTLLCHNHSFTVAVTVNTDKGYQGSVSGH